MFTRSHRRAAVVCGLLMTASLGSLMACSKATTEKASEAVSAAASDVSSNISSVAADVDASRTKAFVEKAAIANMFEIKTSELAVKTSKNADVLAFAKLMIKDHTKAGKAFSQAVTASTSGLTPPAALDEDHQTKLDDLATKTGADFDKAYVDLQKSAHDDAVGLFNDYSQNGKDDALKTFAADTLPTLQMHQDHVKALKV